jgi:DNA repair protein RadC
VTPVGERPPGDRPRERLEALGPAALSESELIALIIRTGAPHLDVLRLAARVATWAQGPRELGRLRIGDLSTIPGLGRAKAAAIVAAMELGRRALATTPFDRPIIRGPGDAAALLLPGLAWLDREESHVLVLDRRHRLLRVALVGLGGVAHAPMEPREVFQLALREPAAAAFLVVHNHPSGDPSPSAEDLAVTHRLELGAGLLGLDFVDHVIVGSGGWTSLRTHASEAPVRLPAS